MQTIKNQKEYIKYLEDYMFISEANRPIGGSSYKLPFLAESIKGYRDSQKSVGPKFIVFATIFNILLTSTIMGITIIWSINEVIQFYVPLSLSNIAIVSFVFIIGKTKVRLFREK